MANTRELVPYLEAELVKQSAEHWLAALEAEGVPCGVIQTTDRALAHPLAKERQMVVPVSHPVAGEHQTLGVPIKLSATPGSVRHPAPLLGQHNSEMDTLWRKTRALADAGGAK